MTNKEDRRQLIEASSRKAFDKNGEALRKLAKSREEVESIQKGELSKKTERDPLNEQREMDKLE